MFKMFRVGTGFGVVIVVSPPDADIRTPDAKFYRWEIGWPKFQLVTTQEAWMSISGLGDGWGYERLPDQVFTNLSEAREFAIKKVDEWLAQVEKELKKIKPLRKN